MLRERCHDTSMSPRRTPACDRTYLSRLRVSDAGNLYAGRAFGELTMKLDPVLAEIRETREAYVERFGGDVKAMLADLQRRQRDGGRPSVTRPPRRITEPEVRLAESD
jgi:hypothetical protein